MLCAFVVGMWFLFGRRGELKNERGFLKETQEVFRETQMQQCRALGSQEGGSFSCWAWC